MALETRTESKKAREEVTPDTALWRPQSQMPTELRRSVRIVAGEGPFLIDEHGNRLLDGTASLFLCNVGHANPKLVAAAYRQMKKLEFYQNFAQYYGEPADRLSKRLRALSPIEDVKIFFTSGGSDAIDTACKLARLHWYHEGKPSKKHIVFREKAYHGLHGFGTSVAGLDFNRTGYGESLIPETLRVPWNDLAEVEVRIRELGPENVAAIVEEPVIGSGGVYTAPPDYFEGINRLAEEHEFLVIADEVITGFGRTGVYWGSDQVGIRPDMLAVAKGITSGYIPLGGVLISPRVWRRYFEDESSPILHHGLTYSGHHTACAVAEANLDLIEDEGLVQRVAELGVQLRDKLATVADHPDVVEVRSAPGLLGAVQLPADAPAQPVLDGARESGVILRRLANNSLQVSPPYTIEDEHIDMIVDAIQHGLTRL